MTTIHNDVRIRAIPKFIAFNDSDNASHGIYATRSENIQSIYIVDSTTIDIYIRNPSGGYAAAATTLTNEFVDTGAPTPGTVNIDGVTITIGTNLLGEAIADYVSKVTFTNYIATLQGLQVLFTQKVKGTAGNVAITMSDARYIKADGGNHDITADSFSGGSDAYGNASDDKIRITTIADASNRVFFEILRLLDESPRSTHAIIDDSSINISNIDYIAGT